MPETETESDIVIMLSRGGERKFENSKMKLKVGLRLSEETLDVDVVDVVDVPYLECGEVLEA